MEKELRAAFEVNKIVKMKRDGFPDGYSFFVEGRLVYIINVWEGVFNFSFFDTYHTLDYRMIKLGDWYGYGIRIGNTNFPSSFQFNYGVETKKLEGKGAILSATILNGCVPNMVKGMYKLGYDLSYALDGIQISSHEKIEWKKKYEQLLNAR